MPRGRGQPEEQSRTGGLPLTVGRRSVVTEATEQEGHWELLEAS